MISPHDFRTSSSVPVLSKGRASDDITDASVPDLTYAKYQDFDVSLDSFCFRSTTTPSLRRPPTPPPPRMKRKNVTFAAPLEEVVEERPGTQEALTEVVAPPITNGTDELKNFELAPEFARGNRLSSRVDGLLRPGERLILEPQLTSPSPHLGSRPSMTAEPPSLLFPPDQRQSRLYITGARLPMAAHAKQKHRANDTLPSPSTKAESTTRESYLIPIMTVSSVICNSFMCLLCLFPGAG